MEVTARSDPAAVSSIGSIRRADLDGRGESRFPGCLMIVFAPDASSMRAMARQGRQNGIKAVRARHASGKARPASAGFENALVIGIDAPSSIKRHF